MTDIEIAQAHEMKKIVDVAAKAGIDEKHLELYGNYKAKLDLTEIRKLPRKAKLILVTAISPTPAGEGKTTTSVGLADALNKLGKNTMVCLREPSLGPVFGVKGGAAGGGYAQVVPMEDINLHFTGDFHAIGAANNLLAALLDNHIQQGNVLGIDPRKIVWKRAVDMNDRQLRHIIDGLGGKASGVPREDGFEITVASEVMAVLCLATGLADLKERLGKMVVAYTYDDKPVTAHDLKAEGAMAALLKDAIKPNMVQTLEAHSRVHPRRPVRKHRPRLQLHPGHRDRDAPERLYRHRSRLRRRPRRREVPRHQMPRRGLPPRRCRHRCDRPRAQVSRRRAQGRAQQREPRSA